jgi:hypothetical protein
MSDHNRSLRATLLRACLAFAAAAVLATVMTMPALSQAAPPPAAPQAVAETPAAPLAGEQPAPLQPQPGDIEPHKENPGLINEIGKLLSSPPPLLPFLKTPKQAIEDFNVQSRDAAQRWSRLTTSSMVTGRVKCPVADNGAPDCNAASAELCQAKGFKGGKSTDTDAVQVCPVKVLLSGKRRPGDCRTDNFVTRALCQ